MANFLIVMSGTTNESAGNDEEFKKIVGEAADLIKQRGHKVVKVLVGVSDATPTIQATATTVEGSIDVEQDEAFDCTDPDRAGVITLPGA